MCLDRLEVGDLTICVYSCPMRALDFRPLAELVDMYGDKHNLEDIPLYPVKSVRF
ncbi:MAG: hypothetical protein JSW38_04285 [Dehalococcoidia bacterium]|nr:MAG: hypothetical protein JSW38_04285 [Dehalococcoidia bacterium]